MRAEPPSRSACHDRTPQAGTPPPARSRRWRSRPTGADQVAAATNRPGGVGRFAAQHFAGPIDLRAAMRVGVKFVVCGSAPTFANGGLKLMNDGSDACDAGGVAVSAGPATGAQIQDALASRSTLSGLARPGNTPTRAAINVAMANRLGATDLGQQ